MVKNTRNKNHSYKLQLDGDGVPFIPIKGKFLADKFGFKKGDHIEVTFRKLTPHEVATKTHSRLRTSFKRLFKTCQRQLAKYEAHEHMNDTECETFFNSLKECADILITLQAMAIDDETKANALNLITHYKVKLDISYQNFSRLNRPMFDPIELESYQNLLHQLKACGQLLDILPEDKGSKFSEMKRKSRFTNLLPHNPYSYPIGSMMVAEQKGNPYNIDNEKIRIQGADAQ